MTLKVTSNGTYFTAKPFTKAERVIKRLSIEEVEALYFYATQAGSRWKAFLRNDWMAARTTGTLQQLRNVSYFGPRGLIDISFPALDNRFKEIKALGEKGN
jgi:hypothetical protein